ncbi:Fe-S cluster assembly protein SufD [Candidatus Liberibacter africanus]|uniref:Putative iron-sulfur cluster assembly protein n=1 Tax=Candidatus Liberibacter africanus PTSAPSY TaxID=1277257 RepID=A0A0G3I9U8_LIBAF|nr:Fe-S cluster assembly protein SufD [Candidatus Liberibacter africanus]AKK20577.1 putative iron-sulfur cluster assembly protein [Candidatus Liberibacter africanus PTSAPSY]QTP64273.1 Fe-S cluster assembly protein SufD [Candidatus Liberibacter africanus]
MGDLTIGETLLLQACDEACQNPSQKQSIADFRKRLLSDFRAQGLLPTRKIEKWHYTDLKNMMKVFPINTNESSAVKEFDPLVANSIQLLISKIPSSSILREKNIDVFPLCHMESKDESSYCLEPLDEHDAIGYINGILGNDGYQVVIPDECHLEVPIELQVVQSGGQKHFRYPINFGVNSRATIIERYTSSAQNPSLVSSVANIKVGQGADITWIIVLDQGIEDTHLGQLRVILEQKSSFKLFVINIGKGLSRRELSVDIEGEESQFILRGINLLSGKAHSDLSMFLRHKVPNTCSSSVVRNIVLDQSTGVFQGAVHVSPEAQGSDARMTSNTLLFSNEGSFYVKPELEIFADDVQCGHGATISDINHKHLYYLMARGIPKDQAYSMLACAFISEIISDINDEILYCAMEKILSAWMKNNSINMVLV